MNPGDHLLEQLKAGSETAWEEAFKLLYPCVLTAARHPLASLTPTEAEDAAIDALTQLVPKIATVKTWEELRALAATIAARRAISEKRRQTAEKRGSGRTESIEDLHEKTEGVFEPAALVESMSETELSDLARLLREAMAGLDELSQKLICSFVMDGLSYSELAEKHGLPLGTVGVRLSRGLKKIRSGIDASPVLLKEFNAYLRS